MRDGKNLTILYTSSAVLFVIILILAGLLILNGDSVSDDNTIPIAHTDSVGEIVNQPLTDFTFTAKDGTPLSLSDLSGQHIMLSFGYTSCPDVCPATLLEYRRIKTLLGNQADDMQFVFISVDPERDTPDVLNRYITRFDPNFIGLQGNDDQLQAIRDEYGLIYERQENDNTQAGYLVTHTASKYLIDPEGNLIRVYSFTAESGLIAEELRDLL